MKYHNLIVYYFSGTGNAKNAASWIIKIAAEKGLATHLINIDRFNEIELPEIAGKSLIGFCTPTHGFNVPPLVLKFLAKFPRVKNADAFILNTRGGLKLHRFFIPGLSGVAQLLPALILRMKGFKIVGMQPLDLPSNWIILHPGLRKKVIDSIYTRCNAIVNNFTIKLLDGKRRYKALLSFPFDLAIIPVAIGYYFIGRFFLAKTLIATDACTNCDLCILKCPVEAIKSINNKPFWTYKCESCMRCINLCPERAIQTTHTYSGLLLVLSSLLITPLLVKGLVLLGIKDWFDQSPITEKIWSIINAFIFIVFVFISYHILHFLMRFKIVNWIIACTSFSKYNFWRRYKSPKKVMIQQK